jgi:hypothetical protein
MAEVLVVSERLMLKDIVVCVDANVTSIERRILVKVISKKMFILYFERQKNRSGIFQKFGSLYYLIDGLQQFNDYSVRNQTFADCLVVVESCVYSNFDEFLTDAVAQAWRLVTSLRKPKAGKPAGLLLIN